MRARYLAGDECLATARGFVVEEDAVAGEDAVALAVVDRGPVCEELADRVGAAGLERRALTLGGLGLAEHLAAGRLVEAGLGAGVAHGVQEAQGAKGGDIGGVLRDLEAGPHVRLSREVVDLVGLDLTQETRQVGAVGDVAVVQRQVGRILVAVLVEMVDAMRIEGAGPPDNAMDLVAPIQEKLCQVGAILPGDAGYERLSL